MMHSKRSLEGYLVIDHRESPGVRPEDIPQAVIEKYGMPPIVGKGQFYESATLSCVHCQAVVILNQLRTRARHHCARCHDYTCDRPSCILECTPFQQLIDKFMTWGAKLVGAQ